MTMEKLLELLKTVCTDSYEYAAPQGVTRCIVAHTYAGRSFYGDDANVLDIQKAQLDILTQDISDTLSDDVCGVLREARLPYSVEAWKSYDDDWAAIRTILQLELI